jgi:uncharacterized protein involved in type VI secretion and phage assembly
VMAGGLIDAAAQATRPRQQHFYGVAVAQVVNNLDLTGLARVQVKLPWLPGFEPWARVAVPLSGGSRGVFVIPQVDDEVLVAFQHGDVRDPYIVGGLWNGSDRPPAVAPLDAKNKFLIKTPKGHEIEIDDLQQKITVKTSTQQKVTIEPQKIELATAGGTSKVSLETAGTITVQSTVSITLKAPRISIQGTNVDVQADAQASLKGGGMCTVQAGLVKIN